MVTPQVLRFPRFYKYVPTPSPFPCSRAFLRFLSPFVPTAANCSFYSFYFFLPTPLHFARFFHLGFFSLPLISSTVGCVLLSGREVAGRMHYQAAAAAESWGQYMQAAAAAHRVGGAGAADPLERVERLASENAVVVFSVSTCCMCHAVKRLFCGMGVNPTVYELDEDPRGKEMEKALARLLGGAPAVPVVFIGGKLVGAMDRVMASHINGTLVPLLKEAGALWL